PLLPISPTPLLPISPTPLLPISLSPLIPYSQLYNKHSIGFDIAGEAMLVDRSMLVVPDDFDRPDNVAQVVHLGIASQVSRDRYCVPVLAAE
ncbi:MAG: hypothetical protein SWX82_34520, partial [Cyanobacteriota bacterium]|nr:hypothetical protein [Cyanobacteriota bacterium]